MTGARSLLGRSANGVGSARDRETGSQLASKHSGVDNRERREREKKGEGGGRRRRRG